ncbi:CDP-alcohol phosphatidyltransferase family protein [Arthrobacter sp. JCM 19049]|uniref:CDP-alcohol phosphatidyltransferase family protein n=1 Tax=Arthrobacter sp. JCM 19049 TaxID=1460643 RepID=UPI0006D0BF76|nr:CDP-alcohol phosphatidyltransferase family protein [Arthrobacter sp. JCM 19049]
MTAGQRDERDPSAAPRGLAHHPEPGDAAAPTADSSICGFIISDEQPVLTLVLAAIFGTTDWVDGFLARHLNQTSSFGQILDPIADRIGVALILVALTIAGLLPGGLRS